MRPFVPAVSAMIGYLVCEEAVFAASASVTSTLNDEVLQVSSGRDLAHVGVDTIGKRSLRTRGDLKEFSEDESKSKNQNEEERFSLIKFFSRPEYYVWFNDGLTPDEVRKDKLGLDDDNDWYKLGANVVYDGYERYWMKHCQKPMNRGKDFCSGATSQTYDSLAKLLRYESSQVDGDKLTTLKINVSRCRTRSIARVHQTEPSLRHRQTSRRSSRHSFYFISDPLIDSLLFSLTRKMNKAVLFVYSPIDEFVMTNVAEFNNRNVISAEHAKVNVDGDPGDAIEKKTVEGRTAISRRWLKLTLEDSVKEVKFTSRLTDSPAIIVDHESSVRKYVETVKFSSCFTVTIVHALQNDADGERQRWWYILADIPNT
ncbi:hypothetical protein PsorP6_007255 [Peronosclerospora sorghi]|uniref:Uncharacterized protein n=1 Tax=Peronosclerospora sorghi TaxID=230839 RepID=A0ACC0W7J8_9STRA|nr:hypothetical protein PsorP6_007255 [Peronosclerospora sorghi]